MTDHLTEQAELPYNGAIRVLGLTAGVLTVLGTISGVAMLLLTWATGGAPHILSILPLLVLPVAFLAFLATLLLTLLRRRAS
ncbi:MULTISPECIES: hypothetical protein [Rothia]|uniref:Uncharacterized protein n=1 Tax=Rothia nasimurium TaxID=85336 RepID=A0A1Y1RNP0_9MICC|nr:MULTISPECIES: hypothetical protein [Rothia]ORC16476.1 hypothetical protein A7979_03925 [Rothia nasimurium]